MANSADTEWSQLEGNFTTNFEYSTGPPHSSSYVLASAPWINDEKPRVARMQAERQVKCRHERTDSKALHFHGKNDELKGVRLVVGALYEAHCCCCLEWPKPDDGHLLRNSIWNYGLVGPTFGAAFQRQVQELLGDLCGHCCSR